MTPEPRPLSPMLLKLMAHMRKVSPEPGFEGFESVSPALCPDAWSEDFRLWGEAEHDDRDEGYGNWVSPFYIDFCAWLAARGAHAYPRRATFERLMREEMGVLITDGEISGLHPKFNRRLKTILKMTAMTRKSRTQAAR